MCCPFTCWPNILLVPTEPFPNSCGEKRGVLSGHSFVALQCFPRWDKMKWPWLGYRKVLLRCRGDVSRTPKKCKLITKTRKFFGVYHRRIGKVPLKEVLKKEHSFDSFVEGRAKNNQCHDALQAASLTARASALQNKFLKTWMHRRRVPRFNWCPQIS